MKNYLLSLPIITTACAYAGCNQAEIDLAPVPLPTRNILVKLNLPKRDRPEDVSRSINIPVQLENNKTDIIKLTFKRQQMWPVTWELCISVGHFKKNDSDESQNLYYGEIVFNRWGQPASYDCINNEVYVNWDSHGQSSLVTLNLGKPETEEGLTCYLAPFKGCILYDVQSE